jgi:hypothetical protein
MPTLAPPPLLAVRSAAEKAGLSLSKIEKLGLLSTAERLGLLTLAEDLLTTEPGKISSGQCWLRPTGAGESPAPPNHLPVPTPSTELLAASPGFAASLPFLVAAIGSLVFIPQDNALESFLA